MPELPEVETVVRDLRPLLVGRTMLAVHAGLKPLRTPWQEPWNADLVGTTMTAITRRGKWILLALQKHGVSSHLLVHLGMTGQFTVVEPDAEQPSHLHLVFALDDGRQLRFRDVRRFGSVQYFTDDNALSQLLDVKLGPEPFELTPAGFHAGVSKANRTLKAILLDQTVVAGVGNIYADEALFRARLHPVTRGVQLTRQDTERLRQAVVAVLTLAIERRGSTIRDYIGGSGLRGGFQLEFAVYGRGGEVCPVCSTPIEVLRVAGRSSHFCPKCQKPKR